MEFGTARYYNSSEFFNESSWWYDESLTHGANGATESKDKFVTSTHSGMEIGKEDGNSDVPYSCGSPLCCELLDTVLLEFNQYTVGSRWRHAAICRKSQKEKSNETDGFPWRGEKASGQR